MPNSLYLMGSPYVICFKTDLTNKLTLLHKFNNEADHAGYDLLQ